MQNQANAVQLPASDNLELFGLSEVIPWHAEWQDMPEYRHDDLEPKYQIIVSFTSLSDLQDFGKLIGQPVRGEKREAASIWFPEAEIGRSANKRYIEMQA